MNKKIYKYFSGDVLKLVFGREGFCGVKCSLPKDYNDPYELFLGVDLTVSPDLLATYRDIVQDIPQFPTTCFSKSPTVTPMWAHYANNHTGFVLEFDVGELTEAFESAFIQDVSYKDDPDGNIQGFLERAAVTMKPRHAIWLQRAVINEAYFSKQTAWSYEQECRLVDSGQNAESVGGNTILFIPNNCVSAIIVGANANSVLENDAKRISADCGIDIYGSKIGKSSSEPFFTNGASEPAIFNGTEISKAENTCEICSEPISSGCILCPWHSITEGDQLNAARSNPLRVLDHYGLLEGYFNSTNEIARRHKSE